MPLPWVAAEEASDGLVTRHTCVLRCGILWGACAYEYAARGNVGGNVGAVPCRWAGIVDASPTLDKWDRVVCNMVLPQRAA